MFISGRIFEYLYIVYYCASGCWLRVMRDEWLNTQLKVRPRLTTMFMGFYIDVDESRYQTNMFLSVEMCQWQSATNLTHSLANLAWTVPLCCCCWHGTEKNLDFWFGEFPLKNHTLCWLRTRTGNSKLHLKQWWNLSFQSKIPPIQNKDCY